MPSPILELPRPTCVVAVHFDDQAKFSKFSYCCISCSRGWQVHPDGSIYPPDPSRVVRFRLRDYPATKIAGFEVSRQRPSPFPPPHRWNPLPEGISFVSQEPYPAEDSDATLAELTVDFGTLQGMPPITSLRWFYRLAVVVEGSGPIWDDPKIHDDGSM